MNHHELLDIFEHPGVAGVVSCGFFPYSGDSLVRGSKSGTARPKQQKL